MKDSAVGEIMLYPCTIASSKFALFSWKESRLYELDKSEAFYLTNTMANVIDEMITVHIMNEVKDDASLDNANIHIGPAFTYCFDKSVEIVYNLRAKLERNVDFNLHDLYYGMGGDKIPEYVQLKITPSVPAVSIICNETINFAKKNDLVAEKGLKEIIAAILFGAMYLGMEFCLNIDLENSSEFESYMED